jgi:hypothetical protein
MNLNLECGSMKKEPLRFCSFAVMVIALLIVFFVFFYAYGMNILSRSISGTPESHPVDFDYHTTYLFLSRVITPWVFLVGATCIILLSLRHVLRRQEFLGMKAEFILIANSLMMIALSLQILGDKIPNKETTDLLYSIALFLVLLALGSLITGFLYKYVT